MSEIKCPICNKPMKEQIDGTCISYQETNCICNIAAPKLIWKEGNLWHYIQQRRIAKRKGNDKKDARTLLGQI